MRWSLLNKFLFFFWINAVSHVHLQSIIMNTWVIETNPWTDHVQYFMIVIEYFMLVLCLLICSFIQHVTYYYWSSSFCEIKTFMRNYPLYNMHLFLKNIIIIWKSECYHYEIEPFKQILIFLQAWCSLCCTPVQLLFFSIQRHNQLHLSDWNKSMNWSCAIFYYGYWILQASAMFGFLGFIQQVT